MRDDPRVSLRAAGIEAFGDDVALLELPEPPPLETGQVLIEVKAAGVGNWEEFVRTGGWDVGRAPPLALGVEAAGEIAEAEPGSGLKPGRMGLRSMGMALRFQSGCPSPLEGEGGSARSAETDEGCWPDRCPCQA